MVAGQRGQSNNHSGDEGQLNYNCALSWVLCFSAILCLQSASNTTKKQEFETDVVLISIGRAANTQNLNLNSVGVLLDRKKRITVNNNFETNVKNIYICTSIKKVK